MTGGEESVVGYKSNVQYIDSGMNTRSVPTKKRQRSKLKKEYKPPTLPVRYCSSRQMTRRVRKNIGKPNLNSDALGTMIKGKSWKDVQYEIMAKKEHEAKVDRYKKVTKLKRLKQLAKQHHPNAMANRELRKAMSWGGAMGDIAAIVYTDDPTAGDTSHFSHELKSQIKKERKIERENNMRAEKLKKANQFASSLPFLLEPVRFDIVRQSDDALAQTVLLERGELAKIKHGLKQEIMISGVKARDMNAVFRTVDKKGMGTIPRKDFMSIVSSMSPNLRMAEVDKIVRHIPSRDGVGGGISYRDFTAHLLGEKLSGPRKYKGVKWLGERGDFFEAHGDTSNGIDGTFRAKSKFINTLGNTKATYGQEKSFSLPNIIPPPKQDISPARPFRFSSNPHHQTAKHFEASPNTDLHVTEKERFQKQTLQSEGFENKIHSKKVAGYREQFQERGQHRDDLAIIRENSRRMIKSERKRAYDEPIMARSQKEYELMLKPVGGKKFDKTYLNHRVHVHKEEIGVAEYKLAMARRPPGVRSPEYRRVYKLPSLGPHGTPSTKDRIFG